MEIIYMDVEDNLKIEGSIVACIGYFDGIHKGHQALIKKTKKIAKADGLKSAIITFFPDPYEVINNGKVQKHIQDFDSRLKIIEKFGLDICVVINFSLSLAYKSPKVFLDIILNKMDIKSLVCGFDFHYGYKGSGDKNTLAVDGKDIFTLHVIDEVKYQNEKISSTRIRNAIVEGDLPLVSELLGYDFFIRGKVIHGLENGRKIGFPTANILYDEEVILPKVAMVYGGFVKVDGQYYKAMINYGSNPSVKKDKRYTLEANIFDFDNTIYDKEIYVYFKEAIREERKFESLVLLSEQLKRDKKYIEEKVNYGNFILWSIKRIL